MNYLYAALAAVALLIGAEQWGEHTIQVEWDKDKAVREAQIETEKKHNQETIDDLANKHKKDLVSATSKAGRDAVARYLRERVLPDCTAVLTDPGALPAEGSPVFDGTPIESGAGSGLEEFATSCAKDALMVLDWQDLCTRQHCEVIE